MSDATRMDTAELMVEDERAQHKFKCIYMMC